MSINVYDFDGTIYDGECTLDFYFFCVRHHPVLVRFVFVVLYTLVRYKMCRVSEEELMGLCREYVKKFLKDCPDIQELAQKFWKKNKKKIKPFYKELQRDDDVVISASFDVYLGVILKELGINNVLCSKLDVDTGHVISLCYRKTKKQLFLQQFSKKEIENFYTDSLNDLPLMQMAKNAYMVKGDIITKYSFDEGTMKKDEE